MKRIRIAQIGTSQNSHGTEIFKTLLRFPDMFEVVGYAFPENEREKFPKFAEPFLPYRHMTVEEILSDPTIDAVTVETEEIYLTKYAIMAAEHGKHIHMEKPGSPNLAAFEKLLDTVKKNGVTLHLGYMYRYNPCLRNIFRMAKEGALGEIISVEAQMSGFRDFSRVDWLKTFPGGMMFYLGCHIIDLVLQLQGAPNRILPFNKATHTHDTDALDSSFALFEYDKGISFVKTSLTERGGYRRRRLLITGTKACVEVKPLEYSIQYPLQYTEYTLCTNDKWSDFGETYRSEDHNRYDDMMCSFARMAAGEMENPYTLEYELHLFKTILECCK